MADQNLLNWDAPAINGRGCFFSEACYQKYGAIIGHFKDHFMDSIKKLKSEEESKTTASGDGSTTCAANAPSYPTGKSTSDMRKQQQFHPPPREKATLGSGQDHHNVPPMRKSSLHSWEHKLYLELFQKYANFPPVQPTDEERKHIQTFQELQQKVLQEQNEFQCYLKMVAERNPAAYRFISQGAKTYIEDRISHENDRVKHYPRHYVQCDTIPLTGKMDLTHYPAFCFLQTLLEVGQVPKVVLPNMNKMVKPHVTRDCEPVKERYPPSHCSSTAKDKTWRNQACSDDHNAQVLAQKYGCNFVISASGLATLMDNVGPTGFNQNWEIPIIVQEYTIRDKENRLLKHKIVYIDRAFIPTSLTMRDKNSMFNNYAIKLLLTPLAQGTNLLNSNKVNRVADKLAPSVVRSTAGAKKEAKKKSVSGPVETTKVICDEKHENNAINSDEGLCSESDDENDNVNDDDLFGSNDVDMIESLETFGIKPDYHDQQSDVHKDAKKESLVKNTGNSMDCNGGVAQIIDNVDAAELTSDCAKPEIDKIDNNDEEDDDLFGTGTVGKIEDLETFGITYKSARNSAAKQQSETKASFTSLEYVVNKQDEPECKDNVATTNVSMDHSYSADECQDEDPGAKMETEQISENQVINVPVMSHVSEQSYFSVDSNETISTSASINTSDRSHPFPPAIYHRSDSSTDDDDLVIDIPVSDNRTSESGNVMADKQRRSPRATKLGMSIEEDSASHVKKKDVVKKVEEQTISPSVFYNHEPASSDIPPKRGPRRPRKSTSLTHMEDSVLDESNKQSESADGSEAETKDMTVAVTPNRKRRQPHKVCTDTPLQTKVVAMNKPKGECHVNGQENNVDEDDASEVCFKNPVDIAEMDIADNADQDDTSSSRRQSLRRSRSIVSPTAARASSQEKTVISLRNSSVEQGVTSSPSEPSLPKRKRGRPPKNKPAVPVQSELASQHEVAMTDTPLSPDKSSTEVVTDIQEGSDVDGKDGLQSPVSVRIIPLSPQYLPPAILKIIPLQPGSPETSKPITPLSSDKSTTTLKPKCSIRKKPGKVSAKSAAIPLMAVNSDNDQAFENTHPSHSDKALSESKCDLINSYQETTETMMASTTTDTASDEDDLEDEILPNSTYKRRLQKQKEKKQSSKGKEKRICKKRTSYLSLESDDDDDGDNDKEIKIQGPDILQVTEQQFQGTCGNDTDLPKPSLGKKQGGKDKQKAQEQQQQQQQQQTMSSRQLENQSLSIGTSPATAPSQKDADTFSLDAILKMQEQMLPGKADSLIELSTTKEKHSSEQSASGDACHSRESAENYLQPESGNVTYHLWSLENKRILLRCKYHGALKDNQQKMQYVNVMAKLEYQPSHGLEQMTVSEAMRNWIASYIRQNCRLIQARVNAFTSQVMMVDDNAHVLPPAYRALPAQALHLLLNMFSKFETLVVGNYLLSHTENEEICHLRKSVQKRGSYDLHFKYTGFMIQGDSKMTVPWIPINTAIMLPMHIKAARIPGTFEPVKEIFQKQQMTSGQKANKKKKKAQKQQQKKQQTKMT